MEFLTQAVDAVNGVLWDYLLIFLLCGTGIYFTIRLKFVQVTKFGKSVKSVFGNFSMNGEKAGKGGMSSFQSLATAIAGQVGTGNLAGAATALVLGGPGAIFWMWVSAFFGMATIFAEATLAQKYKTTDKEGNVTGGPAYYIKAAFKGKLGTVLSVAFSILIVLALGFAGNMVQANSIGEAFNNAFGVKPIYVGIAVAAVSLFVFLGGVKRIASLTEKLVPIMAGLYIIGAVVILVVKAENIIPAFEQIFVGAFNPPALGGAAIGITVQQAMRYGVARGLFSNEAGMGSTPHAHAIAKVKDPCDQGVVAMLGVFIDTFIVLTLTALVILVTDTLPKGYGPGKLEGVELTQSGFTEVFGSFGSGFIAICMLFFAFSTIIGWYFFGEINVRKLFGNVGVKVYAVLVTVFIVVGSALKVDLVWSLADCFNGLMVIPNLLGLLALSGLVSKEYKRYKNSPLENKKHN